MKKIDQDTILNKVPAVTAMFWITKIVSTAMGESMSDFLSRTFNPYVTVILTGIITFFAIIYQIRRRRYHIFFYWIAVAMVAIFGTMLADSIHIVLRIPYAISATAFLLLLGFNFYFWYRSEKTLSVHEITNRKREIFYWFSILFTFGLGTALGDYTAYVLRWGTLISTFVFLAVFIFLMIWRMFAKNLEVLTFWLAYVLTRPLGASFADWSSYRLLDQDPMIVAIFLLVIFICLLIFMATKRTINVNKQNF